MTSALSGSERRRPRKAGTGTPQQDLYAQHVEFGFDEGERAKEVAMLAKRLKKNSGIDMDQALRIADSQVGRKAPKHGRREGVSLADRAAHGTPWERRGIRPVMSNDDAQSAEVDKTIVPRVHAQFARENREQLRHRGRRRRPGRAGTAPVSTNGIGNGTAESNGEEELENNKYPVKPKMLILAMMDTGEEGDEEDEEAEEAPDEGPPKTGANFRYQMSQRQYSKEEEHKLIHHAYITAKQHQTAAREALAKVPDEVLSGDSHFDLASFMKTVTER